MMPSPTNLPARRASDGKPGALGPAIPAGRYSARRHSRIDAVAPLWERLQAGGVSTVYQQLCWAQAMAEHLVGPARAELVLVEVRDEALGAPIMLLPLLRRQARSHSTIEFLDLGVCDYAAPLVAAGIDLTAEEAVAVWAAVRSALPKADLIHIRHLGRKVGGRPNPLTTLPCAQRMALKAFGVAIDGEAATVMQRTAGASTLRDLKKARRRMTEAGEVRFVAPTERDEIEALYDIVLTQRLDRFRELGRFDLLNRPEVRDFYRAAALLDPSTGPVRLFGIRVGETWVATAYGLVHDGAFHGTLLAMGGRDWRRCSPGLTIVSDIVTWSREQGLDYVDFTVGDMPYKAGFGVKGRDLYEIVEPLTLRGWLVTGALRGRDDLKAWTARHPRLFETLRSGIQWYRRRTGRGKADS